MCDNFGEGFVTGCRRQARKLCGVVKVSFESVEGNKMGGKKAAENVNFSCM